MRKYETTLGGVNVTLAATFGASEEIHHKVGDPYMIAREAAIEDEFLKRGIFAYEPKFRFTVVNVPMALYIGIKAGGSDMSLQRVQELVFEEGFIPARDKVTEYLALIVAPRSEEITAEDKGQSSGE